MEELVKLYEDMGDEDRAAKYRNKIQLVRENAEKDREIKASVSGPTTKLN